MSRLPTVVAAGSFPVAVHNHPGAAALQGSLAIAVA
jgi:hypothetical protein